MINRDQQNQQRTSCLIPNPSRKGECYRSGVHVAKVNEMLSRLVMLQAKQKPGVHVFHKNKRYVVLHKKDTGQAMYSWFSIIRTPIICIRTLGRRLTSPYFRHQREKDVAVTGVFLQEKVKLLYARLFPNAATLSPSSTGFRSRFTMSKLAE